MFFLLVIALLALGTWSAFARPRFLSDFAKLIDRPEFVDGFANRLIKRSFLKGEFRDRQVVVLVQRALEGEDSPKIIVSMQTRAKTMIEPYQFTGSRSDREAEAALFALEVTHNFRLRHEDGCLKASRGGAWHSLFSFPPAFDPPKWRSVLEAMHTLAGSIERRPSAQIRIASDGDLSVRGQ